MFEVNRATRHFLLNNAMTIRNGFLNEGLIVYNLRDEFDSYEELEKVYFQSLKRNIRNRLITIAHQNFEYKYFKEIVRWINLQNQNIKLQL